VKGKERASSMQCELNQMLRFTRINLFVSEESLNVDPRDPISKSIDQGKS
jgi:hypothetical protein